MVFPDLSTLKVAEPTCHSPCLQASLESCKRGRAWDLESFLL